MEQGSPPPRRPGRSAADRVRDPQFQIGMRGYERRAVDEYVAQVVQIVERLEATQLRETVVQQALDEVGEQTSGILRRAHEAADEIASQSRAQAEGRMQRAEREADATRREADQYAEQVVEDSRRLWEERRRLIEEMRQFAEDVLSVADDALERLPEPEGPLEEEEDDTEPTLETPDQDPTLENPPQEPPGERPVPPAQRPVPPAEHPARTAPQGDGSPGSP